MKVISLVALLFFAVYVASEGANTIDLDDSNFDTVVDGSKSVFVKFYAPVRIELITYMSC